MSRYPGRRWAFAAVAAATVCTISALYAQEEKKQQEQPQQQNAQQNNQQQQDQAQDQQNRDRNAEQPRTRAKRAAARADQAAAGAEQRHGGISDRDIVAWISVDNDAEIQFSEMAQQKSTNDQVKQFAQQMVEQHGQLAQKLQQAGGSQQDGQQAGQEPQSGRPKLRLNRREEESNRDQNADQPQQAQQEQGAKDQPQVAANEQGQQRTARRLRMAEGHTGLTAFHAEIVQNCMQQKQQILGDKQGAEFDKCFMQAQIGAHIGAIATLQAAQKNAQSSELKQTLQEAEQSTKQHLDQAVALFEQLDKGSAGEGAQKNAAAQRQTQGRQPGQNTQQPANQN